MASRDADQAPQPFADASDEGRIKALVAENARLSEEVAARDNFLAVVAHELNNALTPVVARIDLLIDRFDNWPLDKIQGNLVLIQQAASTFTKRTMVLMDVSRMTSGKFHLDLVPVELTPILMAITESYRPLAARAGCTLTLDIPDGDIAIKGDRLAIEQLLDNLISNAIKYGPGAPISLAVHVREEGYVEMSVSDGGPGISDEARARIFERFERAVLPGDSAAGFGIGLWVVKQLCEAMNATVAITAAAGSGSTFSIRLPRR